MTDTPRTEEEIVEIGARAHFYAAGRVRYGRAAPDWDRHLTERNREQGRAEFRELLSRLRAAGLAVEQDWQPIETAVEGDGAVKIGAASGVSFHMLYVRKARWEHSGVEAESGWFAHAYGLLCFTGSGKPIQVFPTHWRPLPAAPSQENTDPAHPADRRK